MTDYHMVEQHIDAEPDLRKHKSCGLCGSGLSLNPVQEEVEINGYTVGCCTDCYEERY